MPLLQHEFSPPELAHPRMLTLRTPCAPTSGAPEDCQALGRLETRPNSVKHRRRGTAHNWSTPGRFGPISGLSRSNSRTSSSVQILTNRKSRGRNHTAGDCGAEHKNGRQLRASRGVDVAQMWPNRSRVWNSADSTECGPWKSGVVPWRLDLVVRLWETPLRGMAPSPTPRLAERGDAVAREGLRLEATAAEAQRPRSGERRGRERRGEATRRNMSGHRLGGARARSAGASRGRA